VWSLGCTLYAVAFAPPGRSPFEDERDGVRRLGILSGVLRFPDGAGAGDNDGAAGTAASGASARDGGASAGGGGARGGSAPAASAARAAPVARRARASAYSPAFLQLLRDMLAPAAADRLGLESLAARVAELRRGATAPRAPPAPPPPPPPPPGSTKDSNGGNSSSSHRAAGGSFPAGTIVAPAAAVAAGGLPPCPPPTGLPIDFGFANFDELEFHSSVTSMGPTGAGASAGADEAVGESLGVSVFGSRAVPAIADNGAAGNENEGTAADGDSDSALWSAFHAAPTPVAPGAIVAGESGRGSVGGSGAVLLSPAGSAELAGALVSPASPPHCVALPITANDDAASTALHATAFVPGGFKRALVAQRRRRRVGLIKNCMVRR
jgi:hypothetical protein